MLTALEKRKELNILMNEMKNERTSFYSQWKDCGDYILPTRPRFFLSNANKGERKNQKIIDSSATLSARTLRSGMMAGITSPARPWFRLTTTDPGLAEVESVRYWLHVVTTRMTTSFLRSNLYNVLPITYSDMGVFATSAILAEEDFDTVSRYYALPIGSYWIANDSRGKVAVFAREFRLTVRQLVQKFAKIDPKTNEPDFSNLSEQVKSYYDQGQMEAWIDVTHIIRPNPMYNPRNPLPKFKKYESIYFESGMSSSQGLHGGNENFLRESGYDYFPVLAPRWEVSGDDIYGTTCPGMEAIGDIKQLQLGEKRAAQAIEKMINPPMKGPTALKNSKASILPGDITYLDVREGQQGFAPVYEVNPRIDHLEAKQQQIRERISRVFYEDLFLMLAQSDRRQITAREVQERHEEKLLALGPVLEQLNQDLLDPLIDLQFEFMQKQGLIPEPPEELQGMNLKVEYISVMAQAQKLMGTSSIERFSEFSVGLAAYNPEVLDKIDFDQIVDVYGDLTSVPPNVVRSDEGAAQIRQQRAQAQAQQAQMEMLQQGAGAAKDISQAANQGGSNILDLVQAGA